MHCVQLSDALAKVLACRQLCSILLHVCGRRKLGTGKSFSEAHILVSSKPQYDKTLFIELRVQYMKIPTSEHVENMLCTQIGLCFDIQNNLCTQNMFWAKNWKRNSMNNLLLHCGLVDSRMRGSDKYLPVEIHCRSSGDGGWWKQFISSSFLKPICSKSRV
jgi:hypothetical protein